MLPQLDLSWTKACQHIFLIRDPAEVAASFYATMGSVTAEDLGAERQLSLFDEIAAITGRSDWPIIEGCDVLSAPETMLRSLCEALELPFHPSMLSWKAGRRATDGPWAKHWYSRVEASTGFARPRASPHTAPSSLHSVVDTCRGAYLTLRERKLQRPE